MNYKRLAYNEHCPVTFGYTFVWAYYMKPVAVAAQFKVWLCGSSLLGIAGSNPTVGMDVCRLLVLCDVRYRSLRRASRSSRGVYWVWCV